MDKFDESKVIFNVTSQDPMNYGNVKKERRFVKRELFQRDFILERPKRSKITLSLLSAL